MNRGKFFGIVLGFSTLLLVLLLCVDARNLHYARRHTPAGNSSLQSHAIPSSAVSAVSAALGRGDTRYQVVSTDSGFRAANLPQNLTASFDSGDVTLDSGGSKIRVALSAYGYTGGMRRVLPVRPESSGNRVEYHRGLLTEWYVNGPAGLEQGFTLKAPPDTVNGGELQIALSLTGEMAAAIEAGGKSVAITSPDGNMRIRYSGLLAHDSTGKDLPARMDLRGSRLILAIDDIAARYPIIVDPTYMQRGVITANTGALLGAGSFNPGGVAIDVANQTIVAAAQGRGTVTGSAYVFVQQGTGDSATWVQATQLLNVDQSVASVTISEDASTIVVGSCGLNNCSGHSFVYQRPTTSKGWSDSPFMDPTAMLSAPNAQNGDRVGFSVATDEIGDTVAFGAPCDFTAGITRCGSVLVYTIPNSGTWANSNQPTATLTFNQSSGTQIDGLGVSVAMDQRGDTIAAGAIGITGASNQDGIVSVFVRPSGAIDSWANTSTPDATLVEGTGFPGDWFGFSSAIDQNGDTIVVGAPFARINCGSNCSPAGPGAAYVFLKPTTPDGWKDDGKLGSVIENAILAASDGNLSDEFGASVSIDAAADTIVVGAPTFTSFGAAYVFDMPTGGWSSFSLHEDQKLTALAQPDFNGNQVKPASGFGASLFLSSDASLIAVGDPEATVGSNSAQGAVFLFRPSACAVLSPFSGDFGKVPQFTTSQTMQFMLTNSCPTDLKNVNPGISGANAGDFAQTNNCGTSLAGNSSCDLNVTFTPTTAAAESATLAVSDLDFSSPQSASLTGTGTAGNADFVLVPTSANPASANSNCTPPSDTSGSCSVTVIQGNKATYTLLLTSLNGFDGPVNLAAAGTDVPQNCIGLQGHATPTSSGVSLTMIVATNCASGAFRRVAAASAVAPAAPGAYSGFLAPVLVMGLLLGRKLRRRPNLLQLLALALIVLACGGLCACPSSNPFETPPPPSCSTGTLDPATYKLTVTGTTPGNGLSHNVTLTLVLTPCS